MICFACKSKNVDLVLDLGTMPIANNFLPSLNTREDVYPLRLCICTECKLVQLDHALKREVIFNDDYPYFSGISSIWRSHCQDYANNVISKMYLNSKSFVVEIASNDGTLLKQFKRNGIQTLGIEPTLGPANYARSCGLHIIQNYFDSHMSDEIAIRFGKADLIIANNVYAHLSELDNFTIGIARLLKPSGVASIEVAYLLDLVLQGAFDTIYHEHFSYFSLSFAVDYFRKHGLRIYDVDRLKIHGGSIRLWVCHADSTVKNAPIVNNLLKEEELAGLGIASSLQKLQADAENKRVIARNFIQERCELGKKVVGFGAPAKGNTFLNFCGFGRNEIRYLVDGSLHKQGRFSPGSHIPVFPKDQLLIDTPDSIVILPWNITDEVLLEIRSTLKNNVEIVSFFPQFSTF